MIVTLRGKGTYVSSDYKPRKDEYKLMEVKELFKKGIIEAHYMGFKEKDILNIIEELFKELEGVDEND